MAKRGRSSFGGGYANIPSSVLQNIIRQSGIGGQGVVGGATSASMAATSAKSPKSIPDALRELRAEKAIAQYQTLTPEQRAAQYAGDPVLSGKFTNIQDTLAGLYKYQSVQNLLPLSTTTGKEYRKQMKAYNKAAATLTQADQDAYKAFFQLGGTLGSKGTGVNYGLGTNILDTFLGRTTATPGMNLNATSSTSGVSGAGISLPGMNKTTGQMNLSKNQLAKLRTLRSLKKSGAELTANQQKKLKKLKALKNS